MLRRIGILFGILLVSIFLCGCSGQSKSSGKYKHEDKPKPVEGTD